MATAQDFVEGLLAEVKSDGFEFPDMRVYTPIEPNRGVLLKTKKGASNLVLDGAIAACGEVIPAATPPEAVKGASQILRVILDAGVSGTDQDGLATLFQFCARVACAPDFLKRTAISIGYGGSLSPASLRLPAYVVSAAKIMQAFADMGLRVPQLRLFSAQESAVSVNGLERDQLWPVTLRNFALTKLYLREFYPGVADRVVCDFEFPIEGEKAEVSRRLADYLRNRGKRVVAAVRDVMEERCRLHGGNDWPLYMAFHPLLFGDFLLEGVPLSPWFSNGGGAMDTFVSIGGSAEKLFNLGREFLLSEVKDILGRRVVLPYSLRLVTSVGAVYYLREEDEEGLTFNDVEAILACGEGRKNKVEYYREIWNGIIKDPRVKSDFILLLGRGLSALDQGRAFGNYLAWASKAYTPLQAARAISPQAEELLCASIVGSKVACEKLWGEEDPYSMLEVLETLSSTEVVGAVQEARREFMGLT